VHAVTGPFPGFPVALEGDDISELIEAHRDELPYSDQLPTFDPPKHTQHRGLPMRLLTPRRLKENEGAMWRLADRQIDEFLDAGRCEFVGDFAGPFAMLVIADLLGVPEQDHDLFRRGTGQTGGFGSTSGETLAHAPLYLPRLEELVDTYRTPDGTIEYPDGVTGRTLLQRATRETLTDMGLDVTGLTEAQMTDNHGWLLFPNFFMTIRAAEATVITAVPHPDGDPNRCIWHIRSFMWLPEEFREDFKTTPSTTAGWHRRRCLHDRHACRRRRRRRRPHRRSRTVLEYTLEVKRVIDRAKQPGFDETDWDTLARFIAVDEFVRVGPFKDRMTRSEYVAFLTGWAPKRHW
jgi:hypothetical protein